MRNLKPARSASHAQGACVSRLSRRAIQRRWRKPCALQSAHVSWLPGAPFAGSASSRQPSNISCWRFSDVSFSVNVRFAPQAVVPGSWLLPISYICLQITGSPYRAGRRTLTQPQPFQPALRKPSTRWAWSSGRNHGALLRTYMSNAPGARETAFSNTSFASVVRPSWPSAAAGQR